MSRKVQTDARVIQPITESNPNQFLSLPSEAVKKEWADFKIVEPTDRSSEFIERQHLKLSRNEYEREGTDPGLVLIFNQQKFKEHSYREGSRRDVNEIVTTMSRLGYNISESNVFNNLTENEVKDILEKITAEDLSIVNSVIVFFLTHGDSIEKIYVNDDYLFAQDIWRPFAKCKKLKDKPKIFIFQACKGSEFNEVTHTSSKSRQLVSDFTFMENHLSSDMLVVYATTEGNVSYRDPKLGAWFIQELCKSFISYGRRDDILSLVIRATKCVASVYFDIQEETMNGKQETKIRKQMPVFVSTLKKKFYLNRNKDRNIILTLLSEQEDLKQRVVDLEQAMLKLKKN